MTEHRIEIIDDPDVIEPLSGDVVWQCSCGEGWSGGMIEDAARNAAAHQIGETELDELLGIDPADAQSASIDDYILGIPGVAEEARRSDPTAWAWLTEVHRTLALQHAEPLWPIQV